MERWFRSQIIQPIYGLGVGPSQTKMVHEYSSYCLNLFGFPIIWHWTYLMKVIQEMRHANEKKYLRFYYSTCITYFAYLVQ